MDIRLNLIPPQKKEEIRSNKRLRIILKAETVLAIIFLVFFGVLLSFRYILKIDMSGEAMLSSEIEQADQFSKIQKYNDQFKKANEKIKQVAAIDKDQLYWSKLFIKLSQLIVPGVTLNSFSNNDFSIIVSGTADTRDDLLVFKSNLEKEACFSNVDLPLSNLVDKTNVGFQINFDVKEDCLKNQ